MKSSTTSRAGYMIYQNAATWQLRMGNNSNAVANVLNGGTVTPGEWQHLAAVYTGGTNGTMTLYVNGVSVGSLLLPGVGYEANDSTEFRIGAFAAPNRTFDGAVDEVAFYGAELTAARIQARYDERTNNSANYQAHVLADAPVGYWRLDEAVFVPRTSPVAANAGTLGATANGGYVAGSRNTNTGPSAGDGYEGFGPSNSSLALASAAGYVGTPLPLLNNRTAYTLTGWVKRGSPVTTNGGLFGQNDNIEFGQSGANLTAWQLATGGGPSAAYAFDVDWGFLCLTGDSTATKLYFNGMLVSSGAGASNFGTSGYNFNMGSGVWTAGGDYFRGELDEVAVFDKALSPNRVQQLFDAALGNVPPTAAIPTASPGPLVAEGQSYTLTADSTGTPGFTYKWYRDGAEIPGATGRTYTVTSAAQHTPPTTPFLYKVLVINAYGENESGELAVTVSPDRIWTSGSANPTFWDIETSTNWQSLSGPPAVTYFDGCGAVFNGGGDSSVVLQSDVAPQAVTFNNTGKNYTISGGFGITGAAGVSKSGTGKATLATANSYTGTTTVNAGTLTAGNAAAFGTAGTGKIAFGPGSTGVLQLNENSISVATLTNDAITVGTPVIENGSANAGSDMLSVNTAGSFAGVLRDGGTRSLGFAKMGGDFTLSGTASNTHTGVTLVEGPSSSVLYLNKTGGAVAIGGGGTLQMGNGSANQCFMRTLQNEQFGTANGGVVLDFPNTSGNWMRYDMLGTTQSVAGLRTGNSTTQGSGVVQNGGIGVGSATPATLYLNGSGDYIFNGHLRDLDNIASAPLSVIKNGTGTQGLYGNVISYTGGTTVNNGKLLLGAGGNVGTIYGAVTVNAPGTIDYDSDNCFGWDRAVSVLNINNTTVGGADFSQHFWRGTIFNLAGSTLKLGGTNNEFYNTTVNSLASATKSLIEPVGVRGALMRIRDNTPITFNVADGSAPVDLEVSAPIQNLAGNTNSQATKTGLGTLSLSGTGDNSSFLLNALQGTVILEKTVNPNRAVAGITGVATGATVRLGGSSDQIYGGSGGGVMGLVTLTGGTLEFDGRNEGWSRLEGSGLVTNNATGTTSLMTLGETDGTGVYTGTIADGAGTMAVAKAGGGTITLAGTNSYTGGTTVNGGLLDVRNALGGTVVVNNGGLSTFATVTGPITLNNGGYFIGLGTVTGTLTLNNSALANTYAAVTGPVVVNGGRFNSFATVAGAVTIGTGASFQGGSATGTLGLTDANYYAAGTALNVNGDLNLSGVTAVRLLSVPVGTGDIVIMKYTGTVTGDGTNLSLPDAASYRGTPALAVDTTNKQVKLTGMNALSLVWSGTTDNNWSAGPASAQNWNGDTERFYSGDSVTFNDSGANKTVNLPPSESTMLSPAFVTINNSTGNDYTIAGNGGNRGFTGGTSILKIGTGTATIEGYGHNYTGTVTINGGILQPNGNYELLGNTSGVFINDGQLDIRGANLGNGSRHYPFTIAGAGPNGLGAITNTGGDVYANAGIVSLTLTANASVGSSGGRYDIGRSGNLFGTISGGGFTLTKVGTGSVCLRAPSTGITYVVDAGTLKLEDSDLATGPNPITVNNTAWLQSYGTRAFANELRMASGTTLDNDGGGNQTWSGEIKLNPAGVPSAAVNLSARGGAILLSGVISGTANLNVNSGGGGNTIYFSGPATNTFTGITTVYQGALSLGKTGGAAALGGELILNNNASPDVYGTLDNQFAAGTVVTFVNDAGDHGRFDLMGTTQTVAGIQMVGYTTTRGVIQNSESIPHNGTSTLVLDGSGSYAFCGYLRNQTGVLKLTKNGTGTQTLSGGLIDYTGATTVNAGTLRYENLDDLHSAKIIIAPAAVVAFHTATNFNRFSATSIEGTGTFVKTGAGLLQTGNDTNQFARWNMTGGLIDIREGEFRADFQDQALAWTANKASMNIEAGAIVSRVGGNVIAVDALTGAGTVQNINGWGIGVFTVGQNSGSGSFAGTIRDQGGVCALTKVGTGSQTLTATATLTYTGATTVNGGKLLVDGAKTGTGLVTVNTGGTLGGSGSVTGVTTVASGGTLAPGSSVGTLTFPNAVILAAGSTYAVEINGAASSDKVVVTGALAANGTIAVTLGTGYTPAVDTVFDIADFGSISGTPVFSFTNSSAAAWDITAFATNGTIKYLGGGDPYDTWATAKGVTGGKGGDDDGDGVKNIMEFATNSDPKSAAAGARVYAKMHLLGADNALTYTVAARAGAVFAADGTTQTATKDGVTYTVEATSDLAIWTVEPVSELAATAAAAVQAAITPALPTLDAGWEWHTFRTAGGTAADPNDIIRLKVTAP